MLGELVTNHRATINEPLSLPVKLINCLLPAALCPTWGKRMDSSAWQRLRKIQKLIKSMGERGSRDAGRHVPAENIAGLGGKI